ncbi:MAG: hypothetical protein GKR94_30425 [Gammaproteobacteria bacterium]|nr:hypothetical protein [Gammaproteobacteria bacterium]
MSPRSIIWAITAAILIIGALASWFWICTDRSVQMERTNLSIEARRDRLLAAKRLLYHMGIEVETFTQPDWDKILEKNATLMTFSDAWTLGDKRLYSVMRWVEAGGHLIFAPHLPYLLDDANTSQNLLARLGVTLKTIDEDDDEKTVKRIGARRDATSQVTLGGERLRVAFSSPARFETDGFSVLGTDEHGACALQRALGAGHITVLCSAAPFFNRTIGDEQNASFLWALASMHGQRPLWMVTRTDMPPLYLWAWRRFPEAIVFAALGSVLLLWAATRRAGPIRDLPVPQRRQTIEHVEAASRFIWRHGGGSQLLACLRRVFREELERRQPAWAKLAPEQCIARLAQSAQLEPEAVHAALEDEANSERANGKRRDFAAAVRTLQILRKSL